MSKKGGFSDLFFGAILPKVYAWGACVVIIGAMFKILHLPYAGALLAIGLSTEAAIFFLAGFEPRARELPWERVYPELNPNYRGPRRPVAAAPTSGVAQQLDRTLEGAKVGPQLVESLGRGMRSLAESVGRMGGITSAALSTNEYAQNVKRASQALGEMNKSYASTMTAMSQMADSAKDAKEYHTQVQGVTKSLSALNAVYEMELKDAGTHLKSMNKFYTNVSSSMDSLAEAGRHSNQLKDELSKLTSNVSSLNRVYGSMLGAMKA